MERDNNDDDDGGRGYLRETYIFHFRRRGYQTSKLAEMNQISTFERMAWIFLKVD
jgi:hypothetical protein